MPLLRVPPRRPAPLNRSLRRCSSDDQTHLTRPWVSARTIRINTTKVGVVDFNINAAETQALYQQGHDAATEFLATWNWKQYVKRFRGGPQPD